MTHSNLGLAQLGGTQCEKRLLCSLRVPILNNNPPLFPLLPKDLIMF